MDFPGHFQHIFQQLNHQRLHSQLCDCVVVVGSQSFRAHRSILAACSSHFRALLNSSGADEGGGSGFDRGGDGGCGVMELDPEVVTPEAFSTLLDMIYTSTLSLGASNVMDVLLAASHLHLNTVVKACKIYLSKCNFPTSPPKGWRSVQQQAPSPPTAVMVEVRSKQQMSVSLQRLELSLVTSAMGAQLHDGEAGAEVSQSGEVEDQSVEMSGISSDWTTALTMRRKRKSTSHAEGSCHKKGTYGLPEENYGELFSTVTRSRSNREEGGAELSSPDSLKMDEGIPLESRGEEEEEMKYEAAKGEAEEIQLPSQSDSSIGGRLEEEVDADGEMVVKVKVGDDGDEEGAEQKTTVEVKKENLSSSSPDLDRALTDPESPTEDSRDNLVDASLSDEKTTSASPTEENCCTLNPQSCTDPQADTQRPSSDVVEESIDSEGLESLSDLALSCFLNPSSESVIGALEMEDSLATLTVNATTINTDATVGEPGEQCQRSDTANTSSTSSSDSSPSFVFPVTSVPFQQIHGFNDTLILQPAQSSLGGFLKGIRPGISVQASLIQPSMGAKSKGSSGSGASAFRRIAPKVMPCSEACTDPDLSSSSGSAGDAADRPPLTRASDDVLSKCKKAAAEDHVLLVEGEKKYACRICCKTFMNLTDCKKHIRVHTGEKPYPCPKCGKRFSQSSHLYKHSKNTCLHWKGNHQPFPDALL
ncbi:zinc finger and BTB domain-containing protein 5-like [Lampris incognitus]|uniref:zinc finger and BTB domain-containing protein 5-like n=1 Tax=Lampris incognitus TaxID=2546036 RepID=UPI0024B481BF|nr:zinc finger and BTB domain-containing protein 5-like [Lampris incognitus]